MKYLYTFAALLLITIFAAIWIEPRIANARKIQNAELPTMRRLGDRTPHLTRCPVCRAEISSAAPICVQCGNPR